MGVCCNRLDVDDVDERVGWRFEQHEVGLLGDGLPHQRQVGGVEMLDLDLVFALGKVQQTVGTSVQVLTGHDLVVRLQVGQDDVQTGHAGVDGVDVLAIDDGGQVVLQNCPGWVPRTRVVVVLRGERADRVGLERCRLVDRWNGRLVAVLVGHLHDPGVDTVLLAAVSHVCV